MIVAGRVSQKMAPVLRQIYDQMAEPKWVLAMGVCASSGGMFNNYAIVQGVDHVVPVDMYLPGCPPRPEMLIDAILKLHDQVQHASSAPTARRDRRAGDRGAERAADLGDEGPAAVSRRDRRTARASARAPKTDDQTRPSSRHRAVAGEPPGHRPDRHRGRRRPARGMFGVQRHRRHLRVRRPGRAGGAARRHAQRPYGGWFDEVADALDRAGGPARRRVEKVVVHRGEITFFIRRERAASSVARLLRDDAALRFEFCAGVCGVHYPDDAGRELHAVYHLLSMTHNRRIRLEVTCPDADPHIPSVVRGLPDQRLARARDLGLLRDHLRRPPRADPDPDARRLAGPPAAQGLPPGRHPGGVQGRHDPAAGHAEVVQLMSTDHRQTRTPPPRPTPARAGSSPSPARTGTRSSRASPRTARPTSASWSTWARSTRRPTACSG